MDAPEISVYGEAKGEYTRQLCIFLMPCLETYFLQMLDEAKKQSPIASKHLWNFQSLLQAIPDWNQDKVLRETEAIQKDCRCDYLEELLTAVFIAHTKVLSAIRLTTKQKKLQITIPKIDHFLHRVLSDCARSLWTNAYLFADTNSIEKQKNLRVVSGLIQDSILQAIRGLLPVKSILREYLHEDDADKDKEDKDDKDDDEEEEPVAAQPASEAPAPVIDLSGSEAPAPVIDLSGSEASAPEVASPPTPTPEVAPAPAPALAPALAPAPAPLIPVADTPQEAPVQSPMIYIDTKPSVSFNQGHVFFDSDNLEANEIHDIPFAEAETRQEEEDEQDYDTLKITDEILQMDADETIA